MPDPGEFQPVEINEKIYTETEIVDVLVGLSVVYHQTPWPVRFLMRPWYNALRAAAVSFARGSLENDSLFDSVEGWLDETRNS